METEPKALPQNWGKQNATHWVRRSELKELSLRGGSQTKCAKMLGIHRGQLIRWINHQPWGCFIPAKLAPNLDRYLETLKPPVDKPNGEASAGPTTKPRVSAASPRLIVLSETASARLCADLADVAFRRDNLAPQLEDNPVEIACYVNLRTIGIGGGYELGIRRARLVFERAAGGRGRFAAQALAQVLSGAEIEIHGTPDRMVVEFKARGASALRANGMEEAVTPIGAYCGVTVGESFAIRLLVAAESDFVCVRGPSSGGDDVQSINKKKVIAQFAKWGKNIPADAVDIELFAQVWGFESYREL